MKISASFLSSSNLKKTVYELSVTDVDYIHVDFIDGKFVSGTKIAYRKIKKVTKFSSKRLDVHLMTNKLDKYIKKLDDSTLKVTFRYQLSDCTFLYLLSFGEYVEIIEPVEARNILKEKAKKIFDILKISQPNGNKITVIQLTLRRF